MTAAPQQPAPDTGEVRYEHPAPEPGTGRAREIEDQAALVAVLESGASLAGLRFQGLDLTGHEAALLARQDVRGLVVLGGQLTPTLDEHLRSHGAIIFPTDPGAPVRPYRGTLYTPEELYDGLVEGYEHTPDARAYAWSRDATIAHDAYVSALRAIHDDAMADALVDVVAGRRVVGVMGGHAVRRGSGEFARAAELGHRLAREGALVATGGGPGAMEAANLGAWARDGTALAGALDRLSRVPHFAPRIGPWAEVALRVRREGAAGRDGSLRSLGIPTWHYGHEPPNVFGDLVAKFFSNALREDLLLHHSTAGLVVLPGAAGTVQEVFQMATRLYYEVDGRVPPLVLVGREHWTEHLPVWPLLQALGRGRAMAGAVHLVQTPAEAAALVLAG